MTAPPRDVTVESLLKRVDAEVHRPYAPVIVAIYDHLRRRLPVDFDVHGTQCHLTFPGESQLSTTAVAAMMAEVPLARHRCSDIVSDADVGRVRYVLEMETCNGLARPALCEWEVQSHVAAAPDGVSVRRIDTLVSLLLCTDTSMDVQTSVRTAPASVDRVWLILAGVWRVCASTMTAAVRTPGIGAVEIEHLHDTAELRCLMHRDPEPTARPDDGLLRRWFGRSKRRPQPY